MGRPTLQRALDSIGKLQPHDEVLVVADTNQPGLIPHVEGIVRDYGFTYLEFDAGFKHYGCPQRNHGIEHAREGNYLVFQDDTDEFTPQGLQAVRVVAGLLTDPRPMLFEVDLQGSGAYLDCQRQLRCGEVDGHQFVVPNLPGLVAEWPHERYESDWDFIERTLALWDGKLVRVPLLLSICHNREGV